MTDGAGIGKLLEEFLRVTRDMAGAIESEDTEKLEELIRSRAEIVEKIGAGDKSGQFTELMMEIREQDAKNTRAVSDLMEGYKSGIRKMKLSRKSVRLYTGTDLPPDAGFFDKKS